MVTPLPASHFARLSPRVVILIVLLAREHRSRGRSSFGIRCSGPDGSLGQPSVAYWRCRVWVATLRREASTARKPRSLDDITAVGFLIRLPNTGVQCSKTHVSLVKCKTYLCRALHASHHSK